MSGVWLYETILYETIERIALYSQWVGIYSVYVIPFSEHNTSAKTNPHWFTNALHTIMLF